MRRICLAVAASLAFATPVHAGELASARCEGKWVVVDVDAPNTVRVTYQRLAPIPGNEIESGNHFIPDTGGGNPSGDYDNDLLIKVWDNGRVVGSMTLRTPSCVPRETSGTVNHSEPERAPKLVTVVGKAVDGAAAVSR